MLFKMCTFAFAIFCILCTFHKSAASDKCPIDDIYNVTSFCTGNNQLGVTFNAGTSGKIDYYPYGRVGCLSYSHAPAWFAMKIENGGDLTLEMSHSGNEDIDFVCWGPFEGKTKLDVLKAIEKDPSLLEDPGHLTDYPKGRMIDCSYEKGGITEYCHIPDTKENEWYIIVITNYSRKDGFINFTKHSGTASTNCDIIFDAYSPAAYCEGNDVELKINNAPPNAKFHWTGPNGFSSNQKNPVIPNATYLNNGIYSVQLEVDGILSPIVEVDVEVKQKKHTDTTVTINLGESFKFGSQRLYSQGIYFDTLAASTGCDSTVRLNLIVNNEIKVSNTGPYCEGEAVRITAENLPGKISSLIWEGPAGFSSKSVSPTVNNAKPQNSGTYTCFLNVNNQKVKAGETEVVVLSSPNIKVHEKIPVDSFFTFEDTTIKTPGTYTFKLTAENGCDSTISLVLTPEYHELIPSSFLTPNNDGFNDTWFITNIDKVPAPTVSLYDRTGKIVRVIEEYNNANGWDGKDINGNPLPSSDYWYIIDIEGFDKIYTGHVTLLR